MRAHYKSRSGQFTIEVDGGNVKEIVENIAVVQEVFEAEQACGLCASKNIRFQVRENDGNKFYELACNDCTGRFEFGQHKKTPTLFPKRKDKNDYPLPNRGWSKFVREAGGRAA